jgi:nitrate reductase NapE
MNSSDSSSQRSATARYSRREELFAFIVLAVLIWPALAVGVVGGYGFAVWMSQVVLGPPGPPHR